MASRKPSLLVRYLSHPILARWTIAYIALFVFVVGLWNTDHQQAAHNASVIGVPIIAGGFGCLTLWHWFWRSRAKETETKKPDDDLP